MTIYPKKNSYHRTMTFRNLLVPETSPMRSARRPFHLARYASIMMICSLAACDAREDASADEDMEFRDEGPCDRKLVKIEGHCADLIADSVFINTSPGVDGVYENLEMPVTWDLSSDDCTIERDGSEIEIDGIEAGDIVYISADEDSEAGVPENEAIRRVQSVDEVDETLSVVPAKMGEIAHADANSSGNGRTLFEKVLDDKVDEHLNNAMESDRISHGSKSGAQTVYKEYGIFSVANGGRSLDLTAYVYVNFNNFKFDHEFEFAHLWLRTFTLRLDSEWDVKVRFRLKAESSGQEASVKKNLGGEAVTEQIIMEENFLGTIADASLSAGVRAEGKLEGKLEAWFGFDFGGKVTFGPDYKSGRTKPGEWVFARSVDFRPELKGPVFVSDGANFDVETAIDFDLSANIFRTFGGTATLSPYIGVDMIAEQGASQSSDTLYYGVDGSFNWRLGPIGQGRSEVEITKKKEMALPSIELCSETANNDLCDEIEYILDDASN